MIQMMKYKVLFLLLSLLGLGLLVPAGRAFAGVGHPGLVERYYKAQVSNIETDHTADEAQNDNIIVTLDVRNGDKQGQQVTALWSGDIAQSRGFDVAKGDNLIVSCTTYEGQENCVIVERQRTAALIWLGVLFLAAVWGVTKKQGVKAVIAMGIGLAVILFVIVPLILKGVSPFLVTMVGGLVILVPSIYLSHGFTTKSHIALVSIVLAAVVIAVLSLIFSNAMQLTGYVSEESNYIDAAINLRAILLSGILLGALGVIDDIAVTQVAIVNELHHSNSRLSAFALFKRGIQVGKDHIGSVINTLFLAYAGVSLPLIILTQQNQLPFFVAINQEVVATEIMRTLVGTIGLILVVPLTTYIAAELITRYPHRFPAGEHHHVH